MNSSYEDEEKIVWLRDREYLAMLKYVREGLLLCSIRTGPVRAPPGEVLIGYAVLKKRAAKNSDGGFCRRIFTLLPSELYERAENLKQSVPPNSVDPLTVRPGKLGKRLSKEDHEKGAFPQ